MESKFRFSLESMGFFNVILREWSWASQSFSFQTTFKAKLGGALSNLIQLKMSLLIARGLD